MFFIWPSAITHYYNPYEHPKPTSISPLTYDDGNGIIITLIGDIPEQNTGELRVAFSINAPVIHTLYYSFDLYDWRAVKQLGYYTPLRLVNSAYHAAMSAFILLVEQ